MHLLEIGAPAPDFLVKDHYGRDVRLSDFRGKTVVLWFYPKAGTSGWTSEGSGFRDRISDYEKKNVQVLGVSFDTVEQNASFAEKNNFPFPLLCDTSREIGLAYGACETPADRSAKRITYVIDPQGKIQQVHGTVNAARHPEELLHTL